MSTEQFIEALGRRRATGEVAKRAELVEACLAQLGPLVHTDYATVVVALAAGIAGILAFETRAAAAVGVAISITTVPASAYFGVALGLGDPAAGMEALFTLAVNVFFVMFAGTNITGVVESTRGGGGG
mgnify:CR=1 FL=1